MAKMMQRTVTTNVITGAKIEIKDGQVTTMELPDIIDYSPDLTEKKAKNIFTKAYGDQAVMLKMTSETKLYELDTDTFMLYATEKKLKDETQNENEFETEQLINE